MDSVCVWGGVDGCMSAWQALTQDLIFACPNFIQLTTKHDRHTINTSCNQHVKKDDLT